jgi:pullulanase
MWRKIILIMLSIGYLHAASAQYVYEGEAVYNGNDLGVTYTAAQTTFKVWSPGAANFTLRLYAEGSGDNLLKTVAFKKQANNVWEATVKGNWLNKYYTYQRIETGGQARNEVPDIYAKAVGVNGKRGMVVDMALTHPKGWTMDKSPFKGGLHDAIIYELHVRDATIYTKAKNKGKFLGLTETGLVNSSGQPVGLDHLKQLGITHVQLLPSYDFFTVDESIKNNEQYNWGYDPLNYNAPEGSYSTNAYDGNVRIKEFKTLVQTLHKNGIAVIMDVVYNHTMHGEESHLNQLVPGYYYRQNNDGTFSNASGCGNETASERTMMRKFMVESVLHWVKEYHIDGFRFDLMAIHDITTMNDIAREVRKIKPNAILLGEGWTSGSSPLPDAQKALKKNAYKMNNVAVFSDDIRDAIKGSVFDHKDSGIISNKPEVLESIKFGLIGAGTHSQIDYSKVNYSKEPYTTQPHQMIAYNECHDNHTLWDRLLNSTPNDDMITRKNRYTLAMSVVLLSQGIPFIHAGQEFCRTKFGEENSYKSSDSINALRYDNLKEFDDVHNKIKQLIKLRKTNKLVQGNAKAVSDNVQFLLNKNGVLVMQIKNGNKKTTAIINTTNRANPELALPFATGHRQFTSNVYDNANKIPALGCVVYFAIENPF